MNLYKIIIILIGFIFIFFSYLQLNDSDSIIWVIAYLIPAIINFSILTKFKFKNYILFSIIYLILSIYIFISNHEDLTVMYLFNEKTNESLGLMICSIWFFIFSIIQQNN